MLKQLSPPQLWEEFERLCRDLWAELLADPDTLMHGRTGQAQCGVDVYGYDRASGTGELVGVQCKGKDELLGAQLTESELRVEMSRAAKFVPPLKRFIVATTAPRDVAVQAFARELNAASLASGGFSVTIKDWPTISESIQDHPAVFRKYYPEALIAPNLSRTAGSLLLRLPLLVDHEERIAALFELSEIEEAAHTDLRHDIRDLVIELASNAYRHGDARKITIEIAPRSVTIRDDGAAFDLLHALDNQPASPPHQGLASVHHIMMKYESTMQVANSFNVDTAQNELRLTFTEPTATIRADPCLISFGDQPFIGRAAAAVEGDRMVFPDECAVFVVRVERTQFNWSSLYVYLTAIFAKLPPGKRLRIIVPNEDFKKQVDSWFINAAVVEVVC